MESNIDKGKDNDLVEFRNKLESYDVLNNYIIV